MARNKVQFQKGLSEAQFAVLYGTEDQCREAVMRWRWPSGFVCPVCAGQHHSFVKTRALYQCTACRRQTSVIAGTIFAATKVPLCTWFRAMYHLTQSKGGISSIELGRRLGVTQTTAWKDADRGGGRNHTRGQANPLEVAPREGFPPCRNRDLGAAQFPSRQHRCQRRPALLHWGRQRRLRPPADHHWIRSQGRP